MSHAEAAVLRVASLDEPAGGVGGCPSRAAVGRGRLLRHAVLEWPRGLSNGVAPDGVRLAGPHAVLRRGANALALPPSTGRAIEGREHEGALVARELWRLP